MMKQISGFLVKQSGIILSVFIILAAVSVFLMTKVTVNSDMSRYLPADSPTKAGMAVMAEEFPAASSFNLLFEDLSDKQSALEALRAVPNVSNIAYDETDTYNKDGYTLFIISLDVSAYSDEAQETVKVVKELFSDKTIHINGDAAGNTVMDILPMLISSALVLLMMILFIMCNSWVEPLLFLGSIAVAILLNMGTNLIFGSVSNITNAIAAILQLCLSMDYSVMLINRYRQEKERVGDPKEAMENTLGGAFISISSSSITTIVGMLALVFMSFTIGRDIGLVLAKGVFFSLLCNFTVLPALILRFDLAIIKTAKKSLNVKMNKIAAVSYKLRHAVPIVFILLFITSFLLKGNVGITYAMADYYKVNDVFTLDNPLVVLYDKTDEDQIAELAKAWESDPKVKSVNAYATTLGKPLGYRELAVTAGLDEALTAQLYYSYQNDHGELPERSIPLGEFMQFLQTGVLQNPLYSNFFTPEMTAQFGMAATQLDPSMMTAALTAKELSGILSIDETIARQLYISYAVAQGEMPSGQIVLYDFLTYLTDTVAVNPAYASFITEEMKAELKESKAQMESGLTQLIGEHYGRAVITTTLPEESAETFAFVHSIEDSLESLSGKAYVIGASAMASEMNDSFPDEMDFITILTVISIFLVVAVAFRSLSVPLILVCVIQCAVFITMGTAYIQGGAIYYLPLLIVQCLLLGATVDYGILLVSYYREARLTLPAKEALSQALSHSIHTILTSGLILTIVTGILGIVLQNSDPAISEILVTIGVGGLTAMLLVVFILPGLLAAFDRFVINKKV